MLVLIAEGDPSLRRLFRRKLLRAGAEPVALETVSELLCLCARLAPDLVVSAVKLQDGDGLKACVEVRRLRPGVPILIVTGGVEHLARARAAGFENVLLKPFGLAEFDEALRRSRPRSCSGT